MKLNNKLTTKEIIKQATIKYFTTGKTKESNLEKLISLTKQELRNFFQQLQGN